MVTFIPELDPDDENLKLRICSTLIANYMNVNVAKFIRSLSIEFLS